MKLKHPKVFLREPRGVQAVRRNETQQDGKHLERDERGSRGGWLHKHTANREMNSS